MQHRRTDANVARHNCHGKGPTSIVVDSNLGYAFVAEHGGSNAFRLFYTAGRAR